MCRAGRHTLEWARVHMLARYRRLFVYMLINTNNKNQINFMMQKRKNESLWPPKVNKWGRWVVKCKLCEGVLQGSQQGALSQHDLCSLLWLTSVDVQVASHSLTWRWQCCITGCCSWPWQCCLNKVYLLKYSKNYLKDGHGYDERAEDRILMGHRLSMTSALAAGAEAPETFTWIHVWWIQVESGEQRAPPSTPFSAWADERWRSRLIWRISDFIDTQEGTSPTVTCTGRLSSCHSAVREYM